MTEHYHFVGIGGIGMSGLARILLNRNATVTGSDLMATSVTENLEQLGAKVFIGHSAQNLPKNAIVVCSTDIKSDNSEYQAALSYKLPILHRSDLLAKLMHDTKSLTITGTHGKTTTSALLAAVLVEAKKMPSYAVGGIIKEFQSNAAHGQGEYFIAEADESDGSFLKYHSHGAILTNIDLDHMDYFKTEASLKESFKHFASQVFPERLFWYGDDARLLELKLPGVSYGLDKANSLRAANISQKGWKITFDVHFQGKHYPQVEVGLIGEHNVLNALAVFGLSLLLGITEKDIRKALASFQGVERRCDQKGEEQRILVIDDYAHHPTEIRTTLASIRKSIGERRMIVAFQPHRYTRTKDCLGAFQDAFQSADALWLTDVYGAGETPIPGVSYESIFQDVHQAFPTLPLFYAPYEELQIQIMNYLRPHDVVVTVGAGSITQLSTSLIAALKQASPKKLRIGMICGGRSTEHEVSLASSEYIRKGLQQDCYQLEVFGISKSGKWLKSNNIKKSLQKVRDEGELLSSKILNALQSCDVLFPILHGTYGEDGTFQGLCEMLNKAYVGCDHRAAAICMDKAMAKRLAAEAGIPILPFISFSGHDWEHHPETIRAMIQQKLHYPLFVKPTHLGSSIGVSKAANETQLNAAIGKVLKLDSHVIIEKAVQVREIEIGVVGNEQITVLPISEVHSGGELLDFQGKYGAAAKRIEAPAPISQELQEEGKKLAEAVYRTLGCSGFARVDFFLEDSKFWFNEINPIPGCTPTSQFPLVWEAGGGVNKSMVDRLIILALQRKRRQDRLSVY